MQQHLRRILTLCWRSSKRLVLWSLILLNVGVGPVHATDAYDISIRKWSNFYNPTIPWYWWKAQIKAESAFCPNAKSPVGAMGLAQIMPRTFQDLSNRYGVEGSPYSPSISIQLGAAYMGQLRSNFKKPRPEYDRHSLAMASYNAGLGNVLKAQRQAGNTLAWIGTRNALQSVTGPIHSKETRDYVDRIWKYIDQYEKQYPSVLASYPSRYTIR